MHRLRVFAAGGIGQAVHHRSGSAAAHHPGSGSLTRSSGPPITLGPGLRQWTIAVQFLAAAAMLILIALIN